MPSLTRRAFAAAFTAFAAASSTFAAPRSITLEAFAATQLPCRIVVPGVNLSPGVFELRVYASKPRAMRCILKRHGIRVVLRHGSAFLLQFDSLEVRQKAWDQFNADPEWHALLAREPVDVREISLYRMAS
jgi:hypothetical protein